MRRPLPLLAGAAAGLAIVRALALALAPWSRYRSLGLPHLALIEARDATHHHLGTGLAALALGAAILAPCWLVHRLSPRPARAWLSGAWLYLALLPGTFGLNRAVNLGIYELAGLPIFALAGFALAPAARTLGRAVQARLAGPALGLLVVPLAALGALEGLVAGSVAWQRPGGPSLLLITVDTLRADHLSCHGHPRPTSPAIDRLAASGVRFSRAYAQAPATLPSLQQILTSRYGVSSDLTGGEVTLAEWLRDRGYRTEALLRNPLLELMPTGLERGFERVDRWRPQVRAIDRLLLRRIDAPPPQRDPRILARLAAGDRRAEELSDRAVARLRALAPGPFFLWVHYFDPHDPYAPGQHWLEGLLDPAYDGPFDGDIRSHLSMGVAIHPVGPADRAEVGAYYDGEIRQVDAAIGRLLAALGPAGVPADTIVALTADHGESLGEDGLWLHGSSLNEPELHVPLVLRYPPRTGTGGRTIDTVVQTVDLLPTVLAWAGLPSPPGTVGRDLGPLVAGLDGGPGGALSLREDEVAWRSGDHIYRRRWDGDRWIERLDRFHPPGTPVVADDDQAEISRRLAGELDARLGPLGERQRGLEDHLRAVGYLH